KCNSENPCAIARTDRSLGHFGPDATSQISTGRSGLDEATNQQDTGFDTNALSRMSTCRSRANVMRWITEATESARMLDRRCQRAEAGHGDAMGRSRQRVQRECCVADVNALSTGRSEAMNHWGNG